MKTSLDKQAVTNSGTIVDALIANGDVEAEDKAELEEILNRRHVHQYEQVS